MLRTENLLLDRLALLVELLSVGILALDRSTTQKMSILVNVRPTTRRDARVTTPPICAAGEGNVYRDKETTPDPERSEAPLFCLAALTLVVNACTHTQRTTAILQIVVRTWTLDHDKVPSGLT